MSRIFRLVLVIAALCVFAASCGSDGTTDVTTSDSGESAQAGADGAGDDPDAPIPVEPDGGIGDGAQPLPGAEQPEDTGTWHGPQVAETNCPGTDWQQVGASAFSFSVPTDFVMEEAQPIDSEVGIWTGPSGIEVLYDYGWYSGEFAGTEGAENEPIDYSGITGTQTIVREADNMFVGVFFGEVKVVDGQTDRLSMMVRFTDPADEIIGRCIVGSIDWA